MKKYPKYKDSGVEWIGEIPEGWEVISLKRLCKVRRGASPRPIEDDKYFDENGEYSWVRISDVSASERYLIQTEQKLSELGASLSVKMNPQDIFLSIAGSVGKPMITKIKCCIHDGFVWFDNLNYDKEFLYRIFDLGTCFSGLGKFGTQLNLNTDTISSIFVPDIPLQEQQQIVTYLDHKTTLIDQIISGSERKIELLKEQRTATINHAVTKGLNPKVKMKDSGVEWIGLIPEGWEVISLKRLCKIRRGASPRPIDDEKYFDDNGEYSWVRISDVSASERYLTKTEQKLSELGASLSVKMNPQDIFLSIAGSVGKPIITEIKCCIHDGFVWFENLKYDKEFLFRIFDLGTCFSGLGKFGTQLNLNTDTIGSIWVPNIPLPEQQQIVTYLDQKTKEIDNLISSEQKRIELLKEYRQSLISEVVTGKIKVTK